MLARNIDNFDYFPALVLLHLEVAVSRTYYRKAHLKFYNIILYNNNNNIFLYFYIYFFIQNFPPVHPLDNMKRSSSHATLHTCSLLSRLLNMIMCSILSCVFEMVPVLVPPIPSASTIQYPSRVKVQMVAGSGAAPGVVTLAAKPLLQRLPTAAHF